MSADSPDYEGMLKGLLDKQEQKNTSTSKQSRFTMAKSSSSKTDEDNIIPKKGNPFKKNNRGNFNGSHESLDSSPAGDRPNKYFRSPNQYNHYNKPKEHSANHNESVKAFLERMFREHSSMVNTKLNTIMQKVSSYSCEVEKLKTSVQDLQTNNEMLLKLLLEEKAKNAEPATTKKTAASRKKPTKIASGSSVDQLFEDKNTESNVATSSNVEKRVTRSAAKKMSTDESSPSSDDVDAGTKSDDDLQAKITSLNKKMDLATIKSKKEVAATSKTSSTKVTATSSKKDLATGAKKKMSISKVPEHERLMKLAGEKIIYATGDFTCEKCSNGIIDCDIGDGVVLQQCVHTFCSNCINEHVQKYKNEDVIHCPDSDCEFCVQESEIQELLSEVEYTERLDQQARNIQDSMDNAVQCLHKGCRGFVSVEKGVFDFVCPVCDNTNCLDCKKIHADGLTCRKLADLSVEEKLRSYENWLQLNDDPIIQNTEAFDCMVCFGSFSLGEGVVLKNCLHHFCKDCLKAHIESVEDALIKCPFMNDDYSCESVLQDREIKALLEPEAYQKHLSKCLKLAESQMKNTVHCLTPDCEYFVSIEDYPNFTCPNCEELNCVECKAIHTGKTCRQHKEDLLEKTDGEKQADIAASEKTINDLIAQGRAMVCPNCGAHAMKEVGCDAIVCKCRTELCWATKGPRWGPRGTGDISGGCKCGVNGVRCHPNCQNCH